MSEKVVIVGAGGISTVWIPPLKEENVEIAAIVDLNIQTARDRIAQFNLDCEASTDMKAMLKKHKPDFVLDCTIPEAHCDVTCTALKAGCHVIGEKPMASSMAEARKMVKTSDETGMLYMVSQSRRWDNPHEGIRQTINSGEIGDVTTVNCDFYIGAHFGGFRDEMPSPLILDMSIHHFDLMRYMTGADPVAVYAKEFNPDGSWYKGDASASCVFEMSNGIIFTYRGSWCSEGCHTSWQGNWRFIGKNGTLMYENDQPPYGQVITNNEGFNRTMGDAKIVSADRQLINGMHGALKEMLNFLRTGEKPQTECHDNIKSLAMVFSVIESSKKGKRIPVKVM
ncbi:MAG: Gfo/Idh/MocA family protein [Armatimonadota bacterium]